MKFYRTLKLLLLCVLLYSASAFGYEYEINIPGAQGNVQCWQGAQVWSANVDYLYPASLLQGFFVKQGVIQSIGFKFQTSTSGRDDLPPRTTFRIYLANTDAVSIDRNIPVSDPIWTLVFQQEDFNFENYAKNTLGMVRPFNANEWANLIFNTGNEFRYEGKGLLMKVCRVIPSAPYPTSGNPRVISASNRAWVHGGHYAYSSSMRPDPNTNYCDEIVADINQHGSRIPVINLGVEIPAEEPTIGDNSVVGLDLIPSIGNKSTHFLGVIPASMYFDEMGGIYGTIQALSLKSSQITNVNNWPAGRTLRIFMGIVPNATSNNLSELVPGGAPETWEGWQLVYEREDFNLPALASDNGKASYAQGDWLDFKFSEGFEYPISVGNGNIMYFICSDALVNSDVTNQAGLSVYYVDKSVDYGNELSKNVHSTTSSTNCEAEIGDPATNTISGNVPAIRFSVSPSPLVPAEVTQVEVTHPTLEAVNPNFKGKPVLRVRISTVGNDGVVKLNKINFTNTSALANSVDKIELYYTRNVGALDVAAYEPIAEIAEMPADNKLSFEFETPIELTGGGEQHFYLVYDIATGLPVMTDAIDASFDNLELQLPYRNQKQEITSEQALTSNPVGAIPITYHTKIYCPPGVDEPETSSTTGQVLNVMYANNNVARMKMTYTAEELGGFPGSIEEIALYADAVLNVGAWSFDSVFIYMRNSVANSGNEFVRPRYFIFNIGTIDGLTRPFGLIEDMWNGWMDKYTEDGYTLVAGPIIMPQVPVAKQWVSMQLDNYFRYTGGDLDIIIHRSNIDNYRAHAGTTDLGFPRTAVNQWRESRYNDPDPENPKGYQYASAGALVSATGAEATNNFTGVSSYIHGNVKPSYPGFDTIYSVRGDKPNLRLSILYFDGAQYESSNAFHSSQQNVALGTEEAEVLGVMINTEGEAAGPFENMVSITFNVKGAESIATNAKLYYSKTDSSFGAAVQYGDAIALNASTGDITFNLDRRDIELNIYKNYFWLAYEIPNDPALVGQKVDAELVSFTLSKYDPTQSSWRDTVILSNEVAGGTIASPDPAGERTIVAPLDKTTYYVGTSTATQTADYSTLSAFAEDYSKRGTSNESVKVEIISNITENRAATFGYNIANRENNLSIAMHQVATSDYKISNLQNGGSVIELTSGADNIMISGNNSNSKKLTIEKAGNGGDAIKASNVKNFSVSDVNIVGSTNGINLSNVSGFIIKDNSITRASNYAINVVAGGVSSEITKNIIGSENADVNNGLALVNGANGIKVDMNTFRNITSTADSRAIYISGTNTMRSLDIKITNNVINDVKSSNLYASAFEINNARLISIYHNTVIFSANSGAQRNSQIFKLTSSEIGIDVANNLFVNKIGNSSESYSQIYYVPSIELAQITGAGNLYSGGAFYRFGDSDADFAYFEDWKTALSTDNTSNHLAVDAYFVSENDFHTDGEVLDMPEFVVDILQDNGAFNNTDIDNSLRGNSASYAGKATVGADDVFPVIIAGESLPATITRCENLYESILLKYDRRFDKWADDVSRAYSSIATNTWVTDKGDTLESENGIDISRHPFLYIELPNYTNTMKVKAISNIHNSEVESNWCELTVIAPPYLRTVPDVNVCYDAGIIEIETAESLEGSAEKYQWQKRTGTTWINVTGQTTSKLNLTFTETEASINSTIGSYRLQLTPYSVCRDAAVVVYSNEINVNIGNPIAGLGAVELVTSLDDMIVQEGAENVAKVCVNNEIWLTCGLVAGTEGNIMQYQWEKYHPATDSWKAILVVNNETARSDTFRIYSTSSSNAGLYRCQVSGCSTSDIDYSDILRIEVEPASEILMQPSPVIVSCIDKPLTKDDFFVTITEPDPLQRNSYQWYKDGKPYIRLDASGNQITSPSHPSYSVLRTDTTFLQFSSLKIEDAGAYVLMIEYTNCAKEADILYSDTTHLYVYGVSQLKSQTTQVYATKGGYSELLMNMTNTVSGHKEIPPVSYTWYRKVGTVDTELKNSAKYSGATTGTLRINNINEMDINAATGDYYYCVATEYCKNTKITSAPMILKAVPELTITTQPQATEVCQGEDITISTGATSSEATRQIVYTWYKVGSNTPISQGVDNTELTFEATDIEDVASYYCVISFKDFAGANKQTETVALTVNPVAKIAEEIYPTDETIAENSSFELKVVTAANTGTYTYQWYLNGVAITGATNATYSVASAKKTDEGEYYVIVKNQCSEAQGTTVEIQIAVGIEENTDPTFRIIAVLPNPVTETATINFALPDANNVTLTLLDVNGKKVLELYYGTANEGKNTVSISDKLHNIASGAYFILLESDGRKTSFKININK